MKLEVPFFIRFKELERKIKERCGQEYEIVDVQNNNEKWQIIISKEVKKEMSVMERYNLLGEIISELVAAMTVCKNKKACLAYVKRAKDKLNVLLNKEKQELLPR